MGEYDYSTGRPQMPQFREPGGGWDWRQMADMILPGNWWNSRTNQYRPLGIATGVTGLPIEGAVALGRGVGNLARTGANFFGGLRPSATMPSFRNTFGNDINNISEGYRHVGVGRQGMFDRDVANISQRNADEPTFGAGAYVIPQGPGSRPQNVTGSDGRNYASESGARHLGAGQLGRGGDEALQYYTNAFYGRNGALMER
jgi:hypothetical protein